MNFKFTKNSKCIICGNRRLNIIQDLDGYNCFSCSCSCERFFAYVQNGTISRMTVLSKFLGGNGKYIELNYNKDKKFATVELREDFKFPVSFNVDIGQLNRKTIKRLLLETVSADIFNSFM